MNEAFVKELAEAVEKSCFRLTDAHWFNCKHCNAFSASKHFIEHRPGCIVERAKAFLKDIEE